MNLMELLQRLYDEQAWREKKAQQMSSGLGSMPYNFDETMNLKYPGFMEALRKADESENKFQTFLDEKSNLLETKPTTNFLDYYLQRSLLDRRKKDLESILKRGI